MLIFIHHSRYCIGGIVSDQTTPGKDLRRGGGGSGPDLHFLMNNASYTNEKVGGIQN